MLVTVTRHLPLLFVLLTVSCSLSRKPNVVLIMTDDQGYGDLGSHGNPHLKTPVMDRLASESVEFTRFYVSPVCAPTRASLLTGRDHLRTGVYGVTAGRETLVSEETTIAEALKAAGYRTGLVGKWHLGEHYPYVPHAQGFDEFVGFRTGHWTDYFDTPLERNGEPFTSSGYIADFLTDEAIRFMEENRDRPFFLYVPYNTRHSPFQVPDKYFDVYEGLGLDTPTQSVYAMVSNLDDNLGRLLGKIEELGIRDNTILVFLTDNGPNGKRFNGLLRGTKGSVYEGGTRVPFFIRWPKGFKGERKIETIAAHIDLYPTLLELCGVKPPEGLSIDGKSLAPLLGGEESSWPDRMLFTHRERRNNLSSVYPGTVRTQRFNLVNGEELYDVEADPGERTNVAAEHPDVVRELRAAYESWYEEAVSERGYRRLPIRVGYAEENPVSLPAPQAYLEGGVKFAKGPGWAHDWFVGWKDAASRAYWNLDIVRSGRYEISLRYLCPQEGVGTRLRVIVAGRTLGSTISDPALRVSRSAPDRVPRIEAYAMDWGTLPMGVVELEKGETELAVSVASTIGEKAELELQKVLIKKLD